MGRYAQYVVALTEQLGLAPETAVTALADRIREGRLEPPAESEAARVAATRRLPLFGRASAMATLTDAWRRSVTERTTGVAVVLGDAGLGKTRLVEEMIARASLEGSVVLSVRGVEADRDSPWAGVLGLGRGGLLEARGIASAPAPAHAAFAAHITEWGDRFRGASGATAAPLPRAFTEMVRAAADEQPVLLVADDAHLLDRESLEALASLPRDLPTAPLLILLTSRAHRRAGGDSTGSGAISAGIFRAK